MAADITNSPVHYVENALLNGTVSPPVDVEGIHASNTALTGLLTALETLGLITDSTTAS